MERYPTLIEDLAIVFTAYAKVLKHRSYIRASAHQNRRIQALFKDYEREEKLRIISGLVGREIRSVLDLWRGEASAILEESFATHWEELLSYVEQKTRIG